MSCPTQVANLGGNVFHCKFLNGGIIRSKFLNLQWDYSSVCQYPTWDGSDIAVRKKLPSIKVLRLCSFCVVINKALGT